MSGSDDRRQLVARMSSADEKRLHLPENAKFASAFPFKGMNQQAARTAMEDTEFFWLENWLITGPASMRTLWDRGDALYTAPSGKHIIWFAWFNIGAQQYCAVFLNDGTAVQVAQPGGATVSISSTPNTFYTGGQLPFAQQSGSQYLLICNNNTRNDYWIWDGAVLYGAGSVGPFQQGVIVDGGAGYTSVPGYTVFGGAGSGVALTPVISAGSVVSLTITNPGTGYLPGDLVQVAFNGGGSDDGAVLEAVLAAGTIGFVTLLAPGSGFTNGTYALGFTGGGGSGAAGTYIVSGTVVTSVTLTSGGSGYISTPTVSFPSGGGTGATGVASISSDSVDSITVVNGGTNFTGTPIITIEGGGGSGATGIAVMSGGTIASVTIQNGGSGYTSAPAVFVQSGVNNAAEATLQMMPFGISGTAIETFLSRVWISSPMQIGVVPQGGVFSVSAPSSLTDFATSDGGLLFTSSDRFLRETYVTLRQSNGYLYTLGDSSVSVINNVQTGGSPSTTTFNYQNANSQIGASWRDSAQDFNQGVLFANPNGIQGLYGGSVKRVSEKVNNIFEKVILPPDPRALTPSSACANLFTIPVYLLLITITDPATKQPRNVMVGWDQKEFMVASQTTDLAYIGTQTVRSKLTAWGTDGNALFPLFATPSRALSKKIMTKFYGGEREYIIKAPLSINLRTSDMSATQSGIAGTITMEASQIALQAGAAPFVTIPPISAPNPVQPNYSVTDSPYAVWNAVAASLAGTALGATITTTSEDVLLSGLSIAYRDIDSIFD